MNKMNKILATVIATVSVAVFTTNAMAATINTDIEVSFTDNNGVAASTAIEATVGTVASETNPMFGSMTLEATSGQAVTVKGYTVGTSLAGYKFSYGDENDAFAVEGTGLADPTVSTGVLVEKSGLAVYAGLDGLNIDTLQASTSVAGALVAVDYNLDTKDSILGVAIPVQVAGLEVTPALTYANSAYAYEVEVGLNDAITVGINGVEGDLTKGLSAGYETTVGGATVNLDVAYDLNTKKTTPTAKVGFNF